MALRKVPSAAALVSRTPLSLKKRRVPLRLFQGHRHPWKAWSAAALVSWTPSSFEKCGVPLRLFQGHRHLWKSVECCCACSKDTVIFEKASSAAALVSRTPLSLKKCWKVQKISHFLAFCMCSCVFCLQFFPRLWSDLYKNFSNHPKFETKHSVFYALTL